MELSQDKHEATDCIKNPHDKTFKKLMSHVQVAKDLFQEHLPDEILKVVNLNTLVLANTSYVDAQLCESASDVVYQVETTGNKQGYLYCLCEHQSSPDKNMPYRFLQYSCNIIADHINQGFEYLPLVVPILVYNGERSPYPYSLDLFDMFADKDLAKQFMFTPARLVDLTAISDDQLLQRKQADVFLKMLLKHMRARDFLPYFEKMLTLLKHLRENRGEAILEDVINCVFITTQIEDDQRFKDLIRTTGKQKERRVMTLAEKEYNKGVAAGRVEIINNFKQEWIERGIAKGIEQGMVQGSKSGNLKAQRKLAVNLLKEGFAPSLVARLSELSDAEVSNLQEESLA